MGRPIQRKWFGEASVPPTQIVVTGVKFKDGSTAIDAYIIKQTGAAAYLIQDSAKSHKPEILFMVNADSVNALMPGQCFIVATPFSGTALPCESIEQYVVKVYNTPNSIPRDVGNPAVSSVSTYSWSTVPATKSGQADLITGGGPIGSPAILTFSILGREVGDRDVSLNLAGVGMDIHIDWGDGNAPARFATWPQVHTYAEPGVYDVTISGNAILWTATDVTDKLTAVSTFGELPLVSLNGAYSGQTSLTTVPTILPSTVTNISNMFSDCTSFNEDLSTWDVSNVTNMSGTFKGATLYNQDLSGWNISNVTNLSGMFEGATDFNQNLSGWDVSKVTDFSTMFKNAITFDQDVMPWNTSNATGMAEMFNGAAAYGADQDLTGWDITLVPPADIDDPFAEGSLLPRDKYPGYVAPTGAELTYVIAGDGAVSLNFTGTGLDITIDWGDGTPPEQFIVSPQTHTYIADGTYNVIITGSATKWGSSGIPGKMTSITSWGDLPLTSLSGACSAETNLTSVPNYIPPTVTDISALFSNCPNFNDPNVSDWDVSNVTLMNNTFYSASIFNQPLDNWNVSNVTNMSIMFQSAIAFNQPLNNWNVSKVTNMTSMFENALLFNQDLNNWDVSKATTLSRMFLGAAVFNGDITTWNTASAIDISDIFANATAFNQDLSNWNVSAVVDFENTFLGCTIFNGDVSTWDTSSAIYMNRMFNKANAFNQDLSGWDVSKVIGFDYMFLASPIFNGDITTWNTTSAISMIGMFSGTQVFNQNLNNWNVSNVTTMSTMFSNSKAFNQPLNNWNVSKLVDMGSMFQNATAFNQDISMWDVSKVSSFRITFGGATAFNGNVMPWNTASATVMTQMFQNASAYGATQDLRGWDVALVPPNDLGSGFASGSQLPADKYPGQPVIPPGNPATIIYTVSSNRNISLNLSGLELNVTIDWGDGSALQVFTTAPQTHAYATAGTYTASIWGNATTWAASDVKGGMTAITSWGDLPLTSLSSCCRQEPNITSVPNYIPVTVTNINTMFYSCSLLNDPNISNWDTTNVTDMSFLFANTVVFNQPLDTWNVSNVTVMNDMLSGTQAFNQDISGWDVSKVTIMNNMFKNAAAFSGNVMPWVTSSATAMFEMFKGAVAFGATQDLTGWSVALVPPSHLGPDFALGSLLPLDKYPGYVAPPATGGVTAITIVDAGFGYPTAPALTITGDGTGATGTIATGNSGFLHTPVVTAPGTGYTTATITIAPPVVSIQAIFDVPVIVDGVITSIAILNGGTNYFSSTPVTVTGDGFNVGVNSVVTNTVITGVNIYNGGSGYTTATATMTPPTPERQATATATITPDPPAV